MPSKHEHSELMQQVVLVLDACGQDDETLNLDDKINCVFSE